MNIRASGTRCPQFLLYAAVACMAGAASGHAADIDFSNLAPASIVDEVSEGAGVTGSISGKTIGVHGFNPVLTAVDNAAVVFPSENPPPPVNNDPRDDLDLGSPNEDFGGPGIDSDGDPNTGGNAGSPFQNDVGLGNVLIVNEAHFLFDRDMNGVIDSNDSPAEPANDADFEGQFLEFDFSDLRGGGTATVNSVTYMDNDEGEFGAQIEMFGPKIPNQFIALTPVGDNGVNTIDGIGVSGVRLLRIMLNGSGAVAAVTIEEEVQRECWVTLGGFRTAAVSSAAGKKICTFGGNVGPPPNGALEVNWHDGPLAGQKFHTNDIQSLGCVDSGSTGPQQPGGKKGLEVDTLLFDCTGRLNNMPGYTCAGSFIDGGEPADKKGNDPDHIEVHISDSSGTEVAQCIGDLDGGNIQIHPPVGPS